MKIANQLAGSVVASDFDGWSEELRKEFVENAYNLDVGTTLLSETENLKVWHISVVPGERLPAHRHVHDYFWTALRPGRSIQHTEDGLTREVEYKAGDTRHFEFPGDEYMVHDLENSGNTELEFITVEHL